jgi:hypothetical protein
MAKDACTTSTAISRFIALEKPSCMHWPLCVHILKLIAYLKLFNKKFKLLIHTSQAILPSPISIRATVPLSVY